MDLVREFNVGWKVGRGVDDRVEMSARDLVEAALVSIAADPLTLRKQLWVGMPTVEERHLITALERGLRMCRPMKGSRQE